MSKSKPWLVVRTLLITYIISGLLMVALAFALYRFRLPESQINLGVNAIYIISCLVGGFIAGKVMKSRRFLWGLLTGILYFTALFLMSFLQNGGLTDSMIHIATVLGMCAGSGMAGGMLS